MKAGSATIVILLIIAGGCTLKEKDPVRQIMLDNVEHCVTPTEKVPICVTPNGIFTNSDGSLFGVAEGNVFLVNNEGEILLKTKNLGSSYAFLIDGGKTVLCESYDRKEPWKSSIVILDSEGDILWERETGLLGLDGLAVTSDGSFIAAGATDKEKKGHIMLFDRDGNTLWNHQVNSRIETVAVSKNGYVVAGPRDEYIYLYDRRGELLFTFLARSYYSAQDTAIAPDESYFLFGSEHKYLNCYTLQGECLWQEEVGSLCSIGISRDAAYIAVGTTGGNLILLDRNGTTLWNKKVSMTFVSEITISGHGEYVGACTEKELFVSSFEVYAESGELLWRYEDENPFKALVISDDGRYVGASNGFAFFIFDNIQAIEEYSHSSCASHCFLV
ncbi:MAG: PQQ-binding-like beta-propeller repeat protein [Theionarchaea archaeon]|nr:PQQ-binding-like beta-propeller repeat protein [Theionarchaea archaeon]MBU7001498.1 PQQ-binding-like beta-propeller repeat protein [Theionarchaea archaeon]MBU7021524.1 PQQ-binding-like beta-propeller repeat protein [Theionarchaea archaeon]MBU7041426.1 PQQ-binding-like beta-propeller repeat protein [Theionarchaea archaeon]